MKVKSFKGYVYLRVFNRETNKEGYQYYLHLSSIRKIYKYPQDKGFFRIKLFGHKDELYISEECISMKKLDKIIRKEIK